MVDYAFVATLDDSGVTQALGRIDAKMDDLAKTMNSIFEPLNKSSSSFSKLENAGKKAISAIRSETSLLKNDLKTLGTELGGVKVAKGTTPSGVTPTTPTDRGRDIFSQELQRGTTSQDGRDFIQQASRQSGDSNELERVVGLSDQLSESQIRLARRTASARHAVELLTESLTDGSNRSEDAVNELRASLKRAQDVVEESNVAQSTNKAQDAIKKAEKTTSDWIKELRKFDDTGDDIDNATNEIKKLNNELKKAGKNTDDIDKVTKGANDQVKIIERLTKARLRSQQIAEKSLKAQIKAIPEVKNQLAGLADKYNGLIVPIGKTTEELSEQQKEVRDLINSDQRLADVVDDLTKETGEFNLELKRTDFKKASGGMDGMASALGGLSSLLKGGIILAGLRELGRVALRMAEDVARAFQKLTVESSQIADQFKGGKIAFENILPESIDNMGGERLFNTASDISRRLGIDASGIVSAVLPFVDSIEQIDPFAETITELLSLSELGGDPKDQASAIRAVIDTLVEGNAKSIRQMFEITSAEGLDEVIQLAKQGDIVNALDGLSKITAGRGVEFETFTETSARQLGILRENVRLLQGSYGDAINENFSSFLQTVNKFIDENSESIEVIVRRLGEFVAEVGDFVGSGLEDFVKNLDLSDVDQSIGEFINTLKSGKEQFDAFAEFFKSFGDISAAPLYGLIAAFKTFGHILDVIVGNFVFLGSIAGQVLTGMLSPANALREILGMAGDDIEKFEDRALFSKDNLSKAYKTLLKLMGLISASITVPIAMAAAGWEGLMSMINGEGFIGLDELGKKMEEAATDALRETINETQEALNALDGTVAEVEIYTKRSTEEDLASFALDKALGDLEKAKGVILEKRSEINSAINQQEMEFEQERLEMERDHLDELTKLQIAASREIQKMHRDYGDDLEKLIDGNDDDIEDLALKHGRKLTDIESQRELNELKTIKSGNDKKLDAEEAYQQKLGEMRRAFLFSANEAIRQNDAVAFLQLKRKYEFDLREAEIAKNLKNEGIDTDTERELAKVRDDAERKRQEENLANNRSVEDLQIALGRKHDALKKAFAIELREFMISTRQKVDDTVKAHEAEREAFSLHKIEQRRQLIESFNEELAVIRDENAKIEQLNTTIYKSRETLFNRHIDEMTRIANRGRDDINNYVSDTHGNLNADRHQSGLNSPSSSGNMGASQIDQLRDGALRVANDRGYLREYQDAILSLHASGSTQTLIELVERLNKLPRRELGGAVKRGQSYIVGEAGPEVFTSDRDGTIIPNNFAAMLNKQSQSTQATLPAFGSNGGVDNSKNIQVDLSMLNPDSFTSGQLAIIENVVQQTILNATVNV